MRKIVDIYRACHRTNFRGVKICGGVSASRIVIALSACWLINRAFALVTPPSLLRGGFTVTGPFLLPTLVDLRVAGASSGRIIAGATRRIAGTAPGVLLRVIAGACMYPLSNFAWPLGRAPS